MVSRESLRKNLCGIVDDIDDRLSSIDSDLEAVYQIVSDDIDELFNASGLVKTLSSEDVAAIKVKHFGRLVKSKRECLHNTYNKLSGIQNEIIAAALTLDC